MGDDPKSRHGFYTRPPLTFHLSRSPTVKYWKRYSICMGMDEDAALDAAEELLAAIPDKDEDVTDSVYADILNKAKELDSLKGRLS